MTGYTQTRMMSILLVSLLILNSKDICHHEKLVNSTVESDLSFIQLCEEILCLSLSTYVHLKEYWIT